MSGESGDGPWWVVLAVGALTTMAGAIGKLWTELQTSRRETIEAKREATELAEKIHHYHTRDLRLVIGWPGSPVPPRPEGAVTEPSPPLRRGRND